MRAREKHRKVGGFHVIFARTKVEALNIGTKIVKGQIELVSDFKILTVPWSNVFFFWGGNKKNQRVQRKIYMPTQLVAELI